MAKQCAVNGCERPHTSKGYCASHAERVRRLGHPKADQPLLTLGEPLRFLLAAMDHVGEECLIWPFARNDQGYPQVSVNGVRGYAHREICKRRHGPPPTPEHEAAHSCGKGHEGCINPEHLSWKTHAENQADRARHGTDNIGERNPQAKITVQQVREIRALWGSKSQSAIGRLYGISRSTVSLIHARKLWPSVA